MNSTLERTTSPAEQPQRRRHVVVPEPEYLRTPQICSRLDISRYTWRRWVKSGYAPAKAGLPGKPRWTVRAIADFERGLRVSQRRTTERVTRRLRVLHGAERLPNAQGDEKSRKFDGEQR